MIQIRVTGVQDKNGGERQEKIWEEIFSQNISYYYENYKLTVLKQPEKTGKIRYRGTKTINISDFLSETI